MLPIINADTPSGGAYADFTHPNERFPTGRIRLSSGDVAGDLIHELTHAVNREMTKQYYENVQTPTYKQTPEYKDFEQGYTKIMQGRSSYNESPTAGIKIPLEKLAPAEWKKEYKGYRTSEGETPAFGMGNTLGRPEEAVTRAPDHVDPTIATDFSVLLDLAIRAAIPSTSKK